MSGNNTSRLRWLHRCRPFKMPAFVRPLIFTVGVLHGGKIRGYGGDERGIG